MISKIVARYFAIPPERKPSVFSKFIIEGIDDIRSRNEFICEELIKLTRDKKIFWRGNQKKDLFVLIGDNCVVIIRKILSNEILGSDTYLLAVFGEGESGEEINICGYAKPQKFFLPIVDLWDIVAEGKLRDVSVRHTCGDKDFNSDKDVCPACLLNR